MTRRRSLAPSLADPGPPLQSAKPPRVLECSRGFPSRRCGRWRRAPVRAARRYRPWRIAVL